MVKKISAMKDGYEKMSAMEEMLAKKKISPINIKNTNIIPNKQIRRVIKSPFNKPRINKTAN